MLDDVINTVAKGLFDLLPRTTPIGNQFNNPLMSLPNMSTTPIGSFSMQPMFGMPSFGTPSFTSFGNNSFSSSPIGMFSGGALPSMGMGTSGYGVSQSMGNPFAPDSPAGQAWNANHQQQNPNQPGATQTGTAIRPQDTSATVDTSGLGGDPGQLQTVIDTAKNMGVDPALAYAIWMQESGGGTSQKRNANGVIQSGAGALGPFQLMPGTAQGLGVDPNDTNQNIRGGITYIKQLLDQFGGDTSKAIMAYNAGPGNIQRGIIPGETSAYLPAVLKYMEQFNNASTTRPTASETDAIRNSTGLNQGQLGLPMSTAEAFCGPTAAMWFVSMTGRTPSVQEALDLAKGVGWTPGVGMAGPQSEVNLINRMGAQAQMKGIDWNEVAQHVMNGEPVIVDTPSHYFQVVGYDPHSGQFDFGESMRAYRGETRSNYTPAELPGIGRRHGADFTPRYAIYLGGQ